MAEQHKFVRRNFPRRQPPGPSGQWEIYQLPDPNVGNYSPTEVITADMATEIIADLANNSFDFRRQVILAADQGDLAMARDTRLTINRGGGFHITGYSDGTSLILLPQQFTNCCRHPTAGFA